MYLWFAHIHPGLREEKKNTPFARTAQHDVNKQNVGWNIRGRGAQARQARKQEYRERRRAVGGGWGGEETETRKQHLDHMHHQQQRERSRLLGAVRMKGVWGFNMLTQKLAKSQSKQASHTQQGSPFLPFYACSLPCSQTHTQSLTHCALTRFPPTCCRAQSTSVWNTRLTMSSVARQAQGGNFKK